MSGAQGMGWAGKRTAGPHAGAASGLGAAPLSRRDADAVAPALPSSEALTAAARLELSPGPRGRMQAPLSTLAALCTTPIELQCWGVHGFAPCFRQPPVLGASWFPPLLLLCVPGLLLLSDTGARSERALSSCGATSLRPRSRSRLVGRPLPASVGFAGVAAVAKHPPPQPSQ
jgi:hypothetical protein